MPAVSAAQERLMNAVAHSPEFAAKVGIPQSVGREFTKDGLNAPQLAAGTIFVAPDGAVLLLCRSEQEANYGGHWALPGGKGEEGETPWEIACREACEEIGSANRHAWIGEPTIVDEVPTPNGMVFTTFVQPVRYRFVPEIEGEHCGYVWAKAGAFPSPMHPQVARVLGMLFPEGAADEKWITVKPNGPNATGKAVQITENGTITKGMGGKFNGKNISEVREEEEKPSASAPSSEPASSKEGSNSPVTGSKAHQAAKVDHTPREKEALLNYTGAMFRSLNPRLRAGKGAGREDAADLRHLDAVFAKASTTEPMTLYRGVSDDFADKLSDGTVFEDGGFVSTSSDKKKADNFVRGSGAAMLEIRVPKGSKAISVADFSQFGKSEQEIVLNRGGKFRVASVSPKRRGSPRKIIVEYLG